MVSRFGRFGEELVRIYTRQLLLGLEYLHSCKIVHRCGAAGRAGGEAGAGGGGGSRQSAPPATPASPYPSPPAKRTPLPLLTPPLR
jgi:hypothetical protein